MKLFMSELQYVSELYNRLRAELSVQAENGAESDVKALAEAILRNRDLMSRVEKMNGRLSQLAKEWETLRTRLDTQTRASIQSLASSVRKQAAQLALLMEKRTRELEDGRQRSEKALKEIRQGIRYLASVKPTRTNYPKFVDSRG